MKPSEIRSYHKEVLAFENWKNKLEIFKELFKDKDIVSTFGYAWAMENIIGFPKEEIKDILLKANKTKK